MAAYFFLLLSCFHQAGLLEYCLKKNQQPSSDASDIMAVQSMTLSNKKVAAGSIAGVIVTTLVFIVESSGYQSIDPETAAALTTIVLSLVFYLTPDRDSED